MRLKQKVDEDFDDTIIFSELKNFMILLQTKSMKYLSQIHTEISESIMFILQHMQSLLIVIGEKIKILRISTGC